MLRQRSGLGRSGLRDGGVQRVQSAKYSGALQLQDESVVPHRADECTEIGRQRDYSER